jgi:hypothetical protein
MGCCTNELDDRDELAIDYPAPEDGDPDEQNYYNERIIGCPTPEDGDPPED